MHAIKKLVSTLALAASLSGSALAAGPGPGPSGTGGQGQQGPQLPAELYDLNQDGTITAEEVTAVRQDLFAAADADHSGSLSLAELQALRQAEREALAGARFAQVDTDGSGDVSLAEFSAMVARNHPDASAAMTSAAFNLADADHSGGLSRSEFDEISNPQGAIRQFLALDADASGSVSLDEFLKTR